MKIFLNYDLGLDKINRSTDINLKLVWNSKTKFIILKVWGQDEHKTQNQELKLHLVIIWV